MFFLIAKDEYDGIFVLPVTSYQTKLV